MVWHTINVCSATKLLSLWTVPRVFEYIIGLSTRDTKNIGTRLETPWYYGVLSKTSNTTELLKHEEDPAYSHANDNNQQYHNTGLETYQASV